MNASILRAGIGGLLS